MNLVYRFHLIYAFKYIHDMHIEIAKRYHIDWYDCLWLENIVDSDNLYITERKLKPLIRNSIQRLEEVEAKKASDKQKETKNDKC